VRTLQAMAAGGMRDHVGGGFHRYSVDAEWRVPHFEKMLYDQAQLVLAFVEAAQVSGDRSALAVAEDTLHYVMRQMTHPEGGFYSAEDADSVPPEHANEPAPHKMEGAFYLWTSSEIDRLLGADADLFKRRYGIEPNGNAPQDPQQEFTGKNLLYTARTIDDLAAQTGRGADDVERTLANARWKLFEHQSGRPRPYLDDKILTAWNGLMIAAFARAARVLPAFAAGAHDAAAFLEAARAAARFVRDRLWQPDTATLLRRFRDGHAEIDAYAEDYAYMICGLLELFQADGDPAWLKWAVSLQQTQDRLFFDARDGGWFSTTGRDPTVLLRMKEDYDGAEPTASSMSVMNLLLLSRLIENPTWLEEIDRTLRLFGPRLEQVGRAVPMMGAALSTLLAGSLEVVLVGDEPGRARLRQVVARRYRPFAIVFDLRDEFRPLLTPTMPFLGAMQPGGGGAAAYVCRQFTCQPPVSDPAALEGILG
jgi:uncharacterized protein YyaL (SSP411 family)